MWSLFVPNPVTAVTSLTAESPSDRQCGSLVESSLAHYIWIPLFIQTVLIAAKLAHSWMAAKRQLGVSFIFPMYFWFLVLLCPFWSKRRNAPVHCLLAGWFTTVSCDAVVRSVVLYVLPIDALWSGYLQLCAVEPLVSAIREGVAFFLCQTGVGRNTIRRTVILSLLWCLAQVTVAVCTNDESRPFSARFFFFFCSFSDCLSLSLCRVKRCSGSDPTKRVYSGRPTCTGSSATAASASCTFVC